MATAPTLPIMPLEQYLNSSWRPDMEYVDGVLVERNVGTLPHSRLRRVLLLHFDRFRSTMRIEALPECRTKVAETRFRIPDVMVVSTPIDETARVYTGVPLVVIEILSRDDRQKDVLARFGDYATLGVRHLIQMDPEDRETRVYRGRDLVTASVTALDLNDGRALPFNSDELLDQLSRP
ncbi:MAG TPA: Uma2 family endonuclease [Bryobacteraceae bacterium]|nr:Uma2 family endonuclease [Bryobacteraceae bacterium]